MPFKWAEKYRFVRSRKYQHFSAYGSLWHVVLGNIILSVVVLGNWQSRNSAGKSGGGGGEFQV